MRKFLKTSFSQKHELSPAGGPGRTPNSLTKHSLLTLASNTSTGTDGFEAINTCLQKRRSRLIVLINLACEVSPNPAQEGAGICLGVEQPLGTEGRPSGGDEVETY